MSLERTSLLLLQQIQKWEKIHENGLAHGREMCVGLLFEHKHTKYYFYFSRVFERKGEDASVK